MRTSCELNVIKDLDPEVPPVFQLNQGQLAYVIHHDSHIISNQRAFTLCVEHGQDNRVKQTVVLRHGGSTETNPSPGF